MRAVRVYSLLSRVTRTAFKKSTKMDKRDYIIDQAGVILIIVLLILVLIIALSDVKNM